MAAIIPLSAARSSEAASAPPAAVMPAVAVHAPEPPEPAPPAGGGWLRASGPNPRAQAVARQLVAALAGLLVLVALWSALAAGTRLPGPGATWVSAVELFSDPFYRNSPNDQGIGWNVLASLRRVALGFGAAALVGIPLGFVIGRFRFLGDAAGPVISLLRPVSPLAWFPIGLATFHSTSDAAIFIIFITSLWPTVLNTALGVSSIPESHRQVARVFQFSRWTYLTRVVMPFSLPYVLTGLRLSIGIAWLVIVAGEMLSGGTGIGFFVWDSWNALNLERVISALLLIGIVGLILDRGITWIADRTAYEMV